VCRAFHGGVGRLGVSSIGGVTTARYDGLAEWYAGFRPALPPHELDALRRLLGAGPGRCLDIGCGTGVATSFLEELGWTATGVDVSEDLLALARARGLDVVRAPAERLPFGDATFDAVVSVWTHTDVEDFAVLVSEAARVLRKGGALVYVGAHPCFVGPHSLFVGAEGVPELHPGYGEPRRYVDAPGVGNPEGLRARVGALHVPLAGFVGAFAASGLRLDAFEELGTADYPYVVAVRCVR
jgi:SAM-dependent methyltransferase